jgi:hypothetical protein
MINKKLYLSQDFTSVIELTSKPAPTEKESFAEEAQPLIRLIKADGRTPGYLGNKKESAFSFQAAMQSNQTSYNKQW